MHGKLYIFSHCANNYENIYPRHIRQVHEFTSIKVYPDIIAMIACIKVDFCSIANNLIYLITQVCVREYAQVCVFGLCVTNKKQLNVGL